MWLMCKTIWTMCNKFAQINTFHQKFVSRLSKLIRTSINEEYQNWLLKESFLFIITSLHFLLLNCIKPSLKNLLASLLGCHSSSF